MPLDGTKLELTNYATNITNIKYQMYMSRYDQWRQQNRSRLARGNGSFPNFKPQWPCTLRSEGGVVTAAQSLGVGDTITNSATFENQVRVAVAYLSRTKLNNMKRDEGKCCTQAYIV